MGVKTPIVAVTTNALEFDRELFFQAGIDDFQTKVNISLFDDFLKYYYDYISRHVFKNDVIYFNVWRGICYYIIYTMCQVDGVIIVVAHVTR